MNKITTYLAVAFLISGSFVSFALFTRGDVENITQIEQTTELESVDIAFYRSPSCGCCAGHAEALRKAGANVDIRNVDEVALQGIKEENAIPFDKQSCHTAIIEGYVAEGHVPIAAISQFLEEKPNTRGITLPGMPIGTPGMPGIQTDTYNVETLEGNIYWSKDPS